MIFALIENAALALFLLFVVTQLVLPMTFSRPLFPLFRWKGKKAELDDVLREEEEVRLEREIEWHKQKLENLRKGVKNGSQRSGL